MPNLSDLCTIAPEWDRAIQNLCLDTRQIQNGDVFIACQGLQVHGKIHIPAAIQAGAVAILIETETAQATYLYQDIPCIPMPKLSAQLGQIAAQFYQQPSQHVPLIGITGTNGKTSISHFISQTLSAEQYRCGLLGTTGNGLYPDLQQGTHTTPDVLSVQRYFADYRQQGADYLVMEVSSHALDQGRVAGSQFHTAVFSNLSRDHLDYHTTMAEYGKAKQRLFEWADLKYAIINRDDPFGKQLCQQQQAEVCWDYSLDNPNAALHYQTIQAHSQGYQLTVNTPMGKGRFDTPLAGRFNLSNLLAALGAILSTGMNLSTALAQLSKVTGVAGRLQVFRKTGYAPVFVDYAHTPDALKNVLQTLQQDCPAQLICVFGCGGDRDQGKRAEMGNIAADYADHIILTNDNPRHEQAADIIADIQIGIPAEQSLELILDRKLAIHTALNQAQTDDWLLIAGKGHEDYQQIGDVKHPFSDAAVLQALGFQG